MPVESMPQPPQMPGTPGTRRLGRLPRVMMVGGLTAGLALGGAGIAFAATSGSSTPSTTGPSNPSAPGPGNVHRGFKGPGLGGPFRLGGPDALGRVVHGQFTTRTPSGTYKTVEVQVGKVSAVSATSIAVTSTDGYSHTYAVTASTMVDAQRDGISSVAKGDQVEIQATTVNGTDTAASIVDTTKIGASRSSFGFAPRSAPPTASAIGSAL